MKFPVSFIVLSAACVLLSSLVPGSALVTATESGNLRRLEWGGPDGHDNHDNHDNHDRDNHDRDERDREERDREERERDERDHEDERDRDERDHEDEREREEKEREEKEREEKEREEKEREEEERRREEDREREEGRFDCPPDRPWLCAPTVSPSLAPSAVPTTFPTAAPSSGGAGIFGSGVFSSGNITQDAEIGLALGVALSVCGIFLALFLIAYRNDMHKILAMKVLRSESQGFNPRMHEHGTAIDISNRPDDSARGVSMTNVPPMPPAQPDWGAAGASGAVEPAKKSRKSRSGKTIDF